MLCMPLFSSAMLMGSWCRIPHAVLSRPLGPHSALLTFFHPGHSFTRQPRIVCLHPLAICSLVVSSKSLFARSCGFTNHIDDRSCPYTLQAYVHPNGLCLRYIQPQVRAPTNRSWGFVPCYPLPLRNIFHSALDRSNSAPATFFH